MLLAGSVEGQQEYSKIKSTVEYYKYLRTTIKDLLFLENEEDKPNNPFIDTGAEFKGKIRFR